MTKKGAHGGNMVSPVLNREDARIMWRTRSSSRTSHMAKKGAHGGNMVSPDEA
jgi:hypothetical protein